MRVCKPHLIQSFTLPTDRVNPKAKLGDMWHADYMGSAEYEFGAIPKAFRACLSHGGKIEWRQTSVTVRVSKGQKDLTMFTGFFDPNLSKTDYHIELVKMIFGERDACRLKECVDFQKHVGFKDLHALRNRGFWDIDNQVFICFNEQLHKEITTGLMNSMAYLKETMND
jgi:hypothetical protein